jgi:tRNA(Ile)-lysidine synthase
MNDLTETILNTILRHRMIEGGEKLLLAVSGGPDSLCLLQAVSRLREQLFPDISLHVGHLHHGMRPETGDADAEFVEAVSAGLGVPCTVERVSVPNLAKERRIGVEEAGRAARYEFLLRLAQAVGASKIATGHNADDQAETVLMRCIRGAGPRGLGGIPYVRPCEPDARVRIVRPLLDCRRAEIEQFLSQIRMRGRLDSTNLSPDYLRNRIRRSILPQLRKEFGDDLPRRLCALASCAQRLQQFARRFVEDALNRPEIVIRDGLVETGVAPLLALGPAMQGEMIAEMLRSAGLSRKMLSAVHYAAVSTLLGRGGEAVLPGGVAAVASGGRLRIAGTESTDASVEAPARLNIPGSTPLPSGNGRIEAEILAGGLELLQGMAAGREAMFDADELGGKLRVRLPVPGDRMRPLGASGSRKLQDIFTDLRVPRWQRAATPLVTANDEPVWIVGYRTAERGKITPKTRRVLRLRWTEADQSAASASG